MATRGHGTETETETEAVSTVGVAVNTVLVVAFTGVETLALVAWLAVVEGAPLASRAAAVGLGLLVAGLFVEHFLTDLAVNGVELSFPAGRAALFSASEAVIWALWLVIAEVIAGPVGILVAGVVLAVLLVPQHTVEDNVLRGRGLLSAVFDVGTAGFSLVEAAGATGWLLFVRHGDLVGPLLAEAGITAVGPATVGVGILAFALFVEHSMGVAFSRRA